MAEEAKEEAKEEVKEKEDSGELTGLWCGIESNKGNEMEFSKDGSFTVKEGEHSGKGTYQLKKDSMDFTLKDDATGEEMTGTMYVKFFGNHIAICDYKWSPETTGVSAVDYYVRSEEKEKYDSEEGFAGRNTVWALQSGIETIRIGEEIYNADELYIRFQFNVLQICKPEKMGDTTFEIVGYAPYEFSDGCSTIEFFANDPFSDKTDINYEVEVRENTLIFKGSGMEISWVPAV